MKALKEERKNQDKRLMERGEGKMRLHGKISFKSLLDIWPLGFNLRAVGRH